MISILIVNPDCVVSLITHDTDQYHSYLAGFSFYRLTFFGMPICVYYTDG